MPQDTLSISVACIMTVANLLCIALGATLLVVFPSLTIVVAGDVDLSAPWFGAAPTNEPLAMHRRGWEACLRCGGAERLGAIVDVGNVTQLDDQGAAKVIDAVRAHGIIVIKGQNLTRAQQVEFTSKLGEVVVLPSSFEGKDPEPFQPAIQRITNFWANGTWKGPVRMD